MIGSQGTIRVSLSPDGFFPVAFRSEGKLYRVLAVHSVRTGRLERRYRVVTAAGYFDLAFDLSLSTWRVRRQPNWLSRKWYQWLNGARYPLPAWRRRAAPALLRSR